MLIRQNSRYFFQIIKIIVQANCPIGQQLEIFCMKFFFQYKQRLLRVGSLDCNMPFTAFIQFLIGDFFNDFPFVN